MTEHSPRVIDKVRDAMQIMGKCVECTICLQLMSMPVKTSCGHTFCETCIKKVLTRKKAQCPLCDTKLNRRSITMDKHMTMFITGVEQLKKAIQKDVGSDILVQSARPIDTTGSHTAPTAAAPRNSVVEMPSTSTGISKAATNSLPRVSAPRRSGRRNSIEEKSVFLAAPTKPVINGRKRGRRRRTSRAIENRSSNSWSTLNVSRLSGSLSPPKISPQMKSNATKACDTRDTPPKISPQMKSHATKACDRSLNSSLIPPPGKSLQNPTAIRKQVIANRQLFLDRANGKKGDSIEKATSESPGVGKNLAPSNVEDVGEEASAAGDPVKDKSESFDSREWNVSSTERRPAKRKNVAKFLYKGSTRPKVAKGATQILQSKTTQTVEASRIVQSTQTDNTVDSAMIRIPFESFEAGVSPTKKASHSDTVRGNESSERPKTHSYESFGRLSRSTKTISGPGSLRGNDSFEGSESSKLASGPKTTCNNDSFERFASVRADRTDESRRVESAAPLASPIKPEKGQCSKSVKPVLECTVARDSKKQKSRSRASTDSDWSGASTIIMKVDELPKNCEKTIVIPGTESDSSDGSKLAKSARASILPRSKGRSTKKRKRSSSEEGDRVNDIASQWCRNSGSTQCSNKKTGPCARNVLSRKCNLLPEKPRALAALSDESTNVDDIITDWCRDTGAISKFIGNDRSNSAARETSRPPFKRKLSDDADDRGTPTPLRDTSTIHSASSDQSPAKYEPHEARAKPKSSDDASTSNVARRDASTIDVLCATQIFVNSSASEDMGAKLPDIGQPLNPCESPETFRDASSANIVSTKRRPMSDAHSKQSNAESSLNPHTSSNAIPTGSGRAVQRLFKKNRSNDSRAKSGNRNPSLNSVETSRNTAKPAARKVGSCLSTMDSACLTQDPIDSTTTAPLKKKTLQSGNSSYKFTRASRLLAVDDNLVSEDFFESPVIGTAHDVPSASDRSMSLAQYGLSAANDRFNDDIIDRVRELRRNDAPPKNCQTPAATSIALLEDNFDEAIANVNSVELIAEFPLREDAVPDGTILVESSKTVKKLDDRGECGSEDMDLLVVSLSGNRDSVTGTNCDLKGWFNRTNNQKSGCNKVPEEKKSAQEKVERKGADAGSSLEKPGSVMGAELNGAQSTGNKENDNDDSEQDSLMNVTQHQMLIKAFEKDLFGGLPWSPVNSSGESTVLSKDASKQPEQRTPQHRKKGIKKAGLNDKDAEHSDGEDDIVESTPETKVKKSRTKRTSPLSRDDGPFLRTPPTSSRCSGRSRTPTPAKRFLNMSTSTPLAKQVQRIASNTTVSGSAMKPLQHSTPKVLPKVSSNETPLPPPPPPPSTPSRTTASSPVLRTNHSRLESAPSRQDRNARRKVSMVCSGLTPQQTDHVKAFVCMVGGTFKSLFDEYVTHVIVKTEGKSNAAQKTLKYLQGVAHGKWVVGYEWIVESMVKGRLVGEEPYEVIESPNLEAGPRKSRLGQRNLFADFAFMLCGPFDDVSVQQIQDMLLFNGATVFETPVDLVTVREKLKVIVIREDVSTVESNVVDWSRYTKAVLVSHDWIIECISRYRLVSLYPYLHKLEPEDVLALGFPHHLVEDDDLYSD